MEPGIPHALNTILRLGNKLAKGKELPLNLAAHELLASKDTPYPSLRPNTGVGYVAFSKGLKYSISRLHPSRLLSSGQLGAVSLRLRVGAHPETPAITTNSSEPSPTSAPGLRGIGETGIDHIVPRSQPRDGVLCATDSDTNGKFISNLRT